MNRMVFIEGINPSLQTALFERLKTWRREDFVYFEKGPWRRYVTSAQRGDEIATLAARSLVNKARRICVVICVYQDPSAVDPASHPAGADARGKIERAQDRLRVALEELPPIHLIELLSRSGSVDDDLEREAKEALERFKDGQKGRAAPPADMAAPPQQGA